MDRLYINFGWVDIDIQGEWLSGGTYPTAMGIIHGWKALKRRRVFLKPTLCREPRNYEAIAACKAFFSTV